MTKKKIIIISVIVLVVVMIIGGGSYAWFNYFQVSNLNNILVAGNINLKLVEGQDTLSVSNIFPETKEEARMHEDNTLTFEVNGANTSSRAIVYNVLLNEGNTISGKTRFKDDELRFDLSEIIDNNEILLVDNANFSTLFNTNIYDNIVAGNTSTVSHTYKLRMWVDESVIVSETETGNHVYTPSEYKDLYATVKLVVKGETVEGETKTVTFDADGGVVPISSKNVVVGHDYGYLPTPTKEGYTFLGWNGKNLFRWKNDNTGAYGLTMEYDSQTDIMHITGSVSDTKLYQFRFCTSYTDNWNENIKLKMFEVDLHGTDVRTIRLADQWTDGTLAIDVTLEKDKQYDLQFKIMAYLNDVPTEWEPYFITSDTTVVQNNNHTLKAIWQQNS